MIFATMFDLTVVMMLASTIDDIQVLEHGKRDSSLGSHARHCGIEN